MLVSSQVTLGTNSAGGASGLRLWICEQPAGGSITEVHPSDYILPTIAENTVVPLPLTDTFTPGAGSFTVGLCGQLANGTTTWNLSDWAYTTAQVIDAGASVLG